MHLFNLNFGRDNHSPFFFFFLSFCVGVFTSLAKSPSEDITLFVTISKS